MNLRPHRCCRFNLQRAIKGVPRLISVLDLDVRRAQISKAVGVRHLAIHSGFGCTVGPSAQPIRGRSLGRDPSAQTCARRAIRSGLLIGDASDSTADNCCRADQGVQIQCSISTAASTDGCTPPQPYYLGASPPDPLHTLARRFVASLRSRGALRCARALCIPGFAPDRLHCHSLAASSPHCRVPACRAEAALAAKAGGALRFARALRLPRLRPQTLCTLSRSTSDVSLCDLALPWSRRFRYSAALTTLYP